MHKDNHYDAIIIGSGIGGLTLASILSKLNKKKVLILEKHFVAGGQTHNFTRKKDFTWDVGLHYVGELAKGEFARSFFDYITENGLNWHSLPEYFENFHYPDFTFKVSRTFQTYKNDLINKFPAEKKALIRYFKDIKRGVLWNQRYYFSKIFPFYLSWIFKFINLFHKHLTKITIGEYYNKNFKDDNLKAILSSQWISYLMPPKDASFLCQAIITAHYIKGGFYPAGGSKMIADTITPIIKRNHGDILLNREVKEIIVKKNKAVGVKALHRTKKNIEEYYAPVIISNTGILHTYTAFLKAHTDKKQFEDIVNFPLSNSCISLYLGLKKNPLSLGFTGANEWHFDHFDHNKIFNESGSIIDKEPNHFVMSFPSLKSDFKTEIHTAQVLYYIDYSVFEKWKNEAWLKRGKDYYDLKNLIEDKLINKINDKYPGFKDIIEYKELSTPLTIEHFTGRLKGSYNGIPHIPQKYSRKWISIKTSLKNFYITGTDLNFFGIIGGLMGGIATASFLNGPFGFIKIILSMLKK